MGLSITKLVRRHGANLTVNKRGQKAIQERSQCHIHEKDVEFIDRINKIKVVKIPYTPENAPMKSKNQKKEIDCSPETFASPFGYKHISEIFLKLQSNPDTWTIDAMGKELRISYAQAYALRSMLDNWGS